jgi:hypothetical protein
MTFSAMVTAFILKEDGLILLRGRMELRARPGNADSHVVATIPQDGYSTTTVLIGVPCDLAHEGALHVLE